MNVLVLNCGSSSLRFQLIETDDERMRRDEDRCHVQGIVERIGAHALATVQLEEGPPVRWDQPLRDHKAAIDAVLRWILSEDSGIDLHAIGDVEAIGHRVVHGGERFSKSVLIDADVLQAIDACVELAPLHNPANLRGIRAATEIFGQGTPQVAVFDTAFHATMPETSFLYGIPYQYYRRHKIRRYGFHGTSHRYVAYRYRKLLGHSADDVNVITLHLGNGCSACAIKNGKSMDTSMGFTPLEGLLMGTRSGDVDPSILDYLQHKDGLSATDLESLLNKQSGLLGLSGLTPDMRDLLAEVAEHDDRRAKLAIDIFCYRVRKYIGAYVWAMGGADAVVFSGGIGENAPEIRERIVAGLDAVGLSLDPARNLDMRGGRSGAITTDASTLKAFVIPTNEELLIARDTVRVITGVG